MLGCVSGIRQVIGVNFPAGTWMSVTTWMRRVTVKQHCPQGRNPRFLPPPPTLVSGGRGPGTAGPGGCCSPWGRPEPHGPPLGLQVPGQPRSGQQRAHAFVRVINSGGIVVNSLSNDCGQRAPSNRVMYVGGAHLMAEVKIISTSQILSQGTNGSPC